MKFYDGRQSNLDLQATLRLLRFTFTCGSTGSHVIFCSDQIFAISIGKNEIEL